MARARTLLELRTETRALTDTVYDPNVSDAQLTVWVNQGLAELWRDLVACDADRYAIYDTISTTSGTLLYDLEDDFLAIRRVERLEGSNRIPLDRFELQEAPYNSPNPQGAFSRVRYRVVGQGIDGGSTQIHFDPNPGTFTYGYWYVQAPQLLVADDDAFDGVAGYEDWIVLYAALRVFIRQQDPEQTGIVAEMARIKTSIVTSAVHRDVGRAPRIADTRRRRGLAR